MSDVYTASYIATEIKPKIEAVLRRLNEDTVSDDEERQLKMEWLRMQIDKARYDMDAEKRRARRETWQIILAAIVAAAALFAAGHFIR